MKLYFDIDTQIDFMFPAGALYVPGAEKTSLPGSKQVFRYPDRDMVGCSGECACGAEALQKPVMIHGQIVCGQTLEQARDRARTQLAALKPKLHTVEYSPELLELARKVREESR